MLKQNPFSLYDFLGYFIPGSFTLLLIGLLNCKNFSILNLEKLDNHFFPDANSAEVLFFILSSYILGHLLSFASSYTIEKYANWKYGYPSKYLLKLTTTHTYFYKADSKIKLIANLWRVVLAIFILPTYLMDLLCSYIGFNKVLTKSLDDFLIKSIQTKASKLISNLDLDNEEIDFEKIDFHRIISHYVYENSKTHQQKMTNYVSLYGLLRTMTFIINFICYFFLIKYILEINFSSEVSFYKLFIIFSLLTLTYIFFMGFMKFYKRYTLEGFMILVITEIPKKNE